MRPLVKAVTVWLPCMHATLFPWLLKTRRRANPPRQSLGCIASLCTLVLLVISASALMLYQTGLSGCCGRRPPVPWSSSWGASSTRSRRLIAWTEELEAWSVGDMRGHHH